MASTSYKIVPKMDKGRIAIFIVIPSIGEVRQIAYIEVPNDGQACDDMGFANEVCAAYRKRLRRSI